MSSQMPGIVSIQGLRHSHGNRKSRELKNTSLSLVKLHFQEPSQKKAEIIKSMEALQVDMKENKMTREHLLKEIEL